jgi:hypothetical protein
VFDGGRDTSIIDFSLGLIDLVGVFGLVIERILTSSLFGLQDLLRGISITIFLSQVLRLAFLTSMGEFSTLSSTVMSALSSSSPSLFSIFTQLTAISENTTSSSSPKSNFAGRARESTLLTEPLKSISKIT